MSRVLTAYIHDVQLRPTPVMNAPDLWSAHCVTCGWATSLFQLRGNAENAAAVHVYRTRELAP